MPKICRSMFAEGDKPKVGSGSKMLGVRVSPDPNLDLPVNVNGNVSPRSGGMSVAPDWKDLPSFLIPKRLIDLYPDARGSNQLVLWTMGDGAFQTGAFANDLDFRQDPNDSNVHGLVEPAREMKIAEFQAALAATQDQWRKVEV